MIPVTLVYDCTASNLGKFSIPPDDLMAGYDTGTVDVAWSDAQFALHPGVVHFDQSPINNIHDEASDVIDVEYLAATLADIPGWTNAAWVNFKAGTRPGQRTPAAYESWNNRFNVTNTLKSAGITSGVGLWIADFSLTQSQATALIGTLIDGFPVIGVQFHNEPEFDISVVSIAWLSEVSVTTPPVINPGIQPNWHHCDKCQSLFYFPGEANSVCPAGGQHDGSKSHNYVAIYVD